MTTTTLKEAPAGDQFFGMAGALLGTGAAVATYLTFTPSDDGLFVLEWLAAAIVADVLLLLGFVAYTVHKMANR